MTATEAALYNQMSGGTLRSKMPSLTHQNLPLSIFLETPDLGYPAWGGTTSGKVSDSDIASMLARECPPLMMRGSAVPGLE